MAGNEVAVLGVGMHPWGKWGRNFVEYGVAAARDALAASGFVDAGHPAVAIHGVIATPDTLLNENDRVEVLRPLLIDPKEARWRRALR